MREIGSARTVYDTICSCLIERRSLSVVRYGDGEAILLNGWRDEKLLEYIFKRQIGRVPSADQIIQVRENLKKALVSADIIGITIDERKKSSDFWGKGLEIMIEAIGEDIVNKRFCNIDVHMEFLEKGLLSYILQNREKLVYVSCRDLTEKFKQNFKIKEVVHLSVPPEIKFNTDYAGVNHYPERFNEIMREIKNMDLKGVLCLVGAGFVGKSYCSELAKQGGVAIDLGSVFDLWAGRKTRGEGRGDQVEDLTWKL